MKKLILYTATILLALNSAFSPYVASAQCVTPTGLYASNITASSAILNWTENSWAKKYLVRYKQTSSLTWINLGGPGDINTNTKFINGLSASTNYEFQIKMACKNTYDLWSDYSPSSFFTTSADCGTPSGLYANNITSNSATLNWTAVNGATGYEVKYRKASDWSWSTVTSTSNSVSINGLVSDKNYLFRVKTFCTLYPASNFSLSSTFTTLSECAIPVGLYASNITANTATLNWSAVNGATSYEIKYKSGWSWTTVTSTSNSIIINVNSNKTYNFKVKTICSGSSSSNYSSPSTFNTNSTSFSCGTPTGLWVSDLSSSSATLNWSAVSGAISYEVKYKKQAWDVFSWTTLTTATNSITISGLLSNHTYDFKVKAICGSSASSNFSSTLAFTALKCETPTDLFASDIASSSATLNWTDANGSILYEVKYKKKSWFSLQWKTLTATSTSLPVSNLNSNTNYVFKVKAKCSTKTSSDFSSEKTFKTTSGWYKTSEEDETTETTSIETQEELQNSISKKNMDITIYPNPAQSFVNIHFDGTTEKAGIKVFDIVGKQVFSDNVNVNNGEYILPVQNLPAGIYQVAIQTKKETIVKKLIVQK